MHFRFHEYTQSACFEEVLCGHFASGKGEKCKNPKKQKSKIAKKQKRKNAKFCEVAYDDRYERMQGTAGPNT